MQQPLLKDEFDYYTALQSEITSGHLGEYVVIKNSNIAGYFKEEHDAFAAMKGNEPGTFLVKQCQSPGTDIITCFNNQVRFA